MLAKTNGPGKRSPDLKMKFTVDQIAQLLGGTVEGDGSEEVYTLSKIEEAQKGSISFLSNLKYEQHLYTSKASAVIVGKDFEAKKPFNQHLFG